MDDAISTLGSDGSSECGSSECGSSEFGVPDHAVVLGGNANRILVTIGIND